MKKGFYLVGVLALFLSIVSFALSIKNSNGDGNSVNNNSVNIALDVKDGYLQYKSGDGDTWVKLLDISTLNGKDGINGYNGSDGKNGKNGLDGDNGQNGTNGKDPVFRVDNNILQWKYSDEEDSKWRDLFEFATEDAEDEEPDTDIVNSVDGDSEDLGCFSNGTKCNAGTLFNIQINDNEDRNFYVLSDNGKKIDLISASNVGNDNYTTVAWYASSKGDTTFGPITLLTDLNDVTSTWTNIKTIYHYDYTYIGEGYNNYNINKGKTIITDINNNKTQIDEENIKITRARLLSLEEAKALGCTTSPDRCPAWLYGDLDGVNKSLSPQGYWLSTPYSSERAYMIGKNGSLSNNSTRDTTGRGIRPVITIRK